jgi:tetratricopeptide (TPR) repeat protein
MKARLRIALQLPVSLPALIFFTASFPLSAQMPGAGIGYGFHVDEFDAMFEHDGFERGGTSEFDAAFPNRRAASPSEESKVSVDVLRHPLTGKARRVLGTALRYVLKGDHARAISALREGMAKIPSVAPYAHAMLGVEYLRAGRATEAVPELTEAATSFPHDAVVHSNFAVSLCVVGQYDRAEHEARLALYLDPALRPPQELMRMIAANKVTQALR